MSQIALLSGATFGLLAVIFGAFGAHVLKEKLTQDQQKSFETGVKFQMYHAIVLLIIGFQYPAFAAFKNLMVLAFVAGTFLFSFSIYGLVLSGLKGNKIRILGPVTPLGGMLLIVGWMLLLFEVISYTN